MPNIRAVSSISVLAFVMLAPAPLLAEEEDDKDDVPVAGERDAPTEGAQVFQPSYFAQYSPRNALDMLSQVPGFVIDDGNNGARGLGQATANVLVNGERFSSKSDSVRDQLRRVSAKDVVRIEIADGATLDIPGLNGQVANVIVNTTATSGQFRWVTGFRPHNTEAQLYGGEVSLAGKQGKLDYSVSLSNNNDRFGADGPIVLVDGEGELIETQYTTFSGKFDNPRLSTNLTYGFSADTVGHLNLKYGADFFKRRETEHAVPTVGSERNRLVISEEDGPAYEIGGDIEFPLGPGKLKLIGLERFERDNFSSTLVDSFADGSPDTGFRFLQTNGYGERIGRFEYGLKLFNADWQLSGEAAFNRLDRASSLFELDDTGEFVELPFPAGTGGVTEDRYEALLSVTRQLSPELTLQATGGAEYSKIEQTGALANARSFTRPKGSVSLAWKAAPDFDVSVEVRRRVGQLGFGDFLASVDINEDNGSGGNNQLQPDQSWNVEVEANKSFGAWGSAKLQVRQAWFEDFVDFFPLENGGEARGNIGDAKRLHVQLSGTLKFDPIGWKGAQLNFDGTRRWMDVADPFVGGQRVFSYDVIDQLNLTFRHDIPNSPWAWGGSFYSDGLAGYSRRYEIGRYWEGPAFVGLFVEHKDLFGMTGRVQFSNLTGARNKGWRTVFDGERPDAPVLFSETVDRRIGPIFRFTLSGNF